MRNRSVRPYVALAAALALAALALGGSAAALSEAQAPLRIATIDAKLTQQLAANPVGGVTAIVTAWNHDDLDEIESLGVRGTKLRVLPMIVTTSLTSSQLERLRSSAFVRSVYANERFSLLMEDSTWITKARYAWSTTTSPGGPQGLGITGQGVEIAVIDTGIDGQHEDADNLIEYCETTTAGGTGSRMQVLCSPFNPASGNAGPAGPTNTARGDAIDDEGHGTHVSGTVAGTGHASGGTQNTHSTIGMAPHAKLRVYSANVATSLLSTQILAAYDDMTYKKLNGLNRVVATSNSFGGGDGLNYDPESPDNIAVKRAYDAGILSVFAAGNSGPEHNTLSRQCVNPYVVCVAASTKPDSVVMFSSRGRPSQPEDTNRDGVVNGDDVQPDNHDRRLGQALGIGLYRPTLTAPGVNIYSMSANSAGCREDNLIIPFPEVPRAGCYEPLNGTSMATPHVSGLVALVVQSYRQGHGGSTPSPAQVTEILERSSNTSKLPAYEAEEQGTGRIDAYEAVRFARTYPNGLGRANIGHATPPFQQGAYPGGPNSMPPSEQEIGCTGTLSWTAGSPETALDPVGQPPGPGIITPRYGQHFINVPPKTERLRITVDWSTHPSANLYVRLWRPGVDPNGEVAPAGPNRVWPDQEAVGLLTVGTQRFLDVRSPEEAAGQPTPPAIPSGQWILRVYHRVGGVPTACGATQENPKQVEGFKYTVKTELGLVTHAPTVRIDSPAANANTTGRFVDVRGRAGYPPPDNPSIGNTGHSWEGVTNWEAPGSAQPAGGTPVPSPDNRPVLYMHGNPIAPHARPTEASCTGDGRTDVALVPCDGPFLHAATQLSGSPAGASWKTTEADIVLDGTADRNIFDPNWVYRVTSPTTVSGAMTVEWWGSCIGCANDIGFQADWNIRLWADGVLRFEQRVTATPESPGTPSRLVETVSLPSITANSHFTLHIDPVYIDSQAQTFIYYDSQNPCAPGATGACDSLVRLPVGGTGGGGGQEAGPRNVRVTDLPADAPYPAASRTPALRVAWDPAAGASSYRVYRSTNPLVRGSQVYSGAGTTCSSPEAPAPEPSDAPPGHDRAGLCFTDTGVSLRATYYYRVVVVKSGADSQNSAVAYGTPTRYDRQVKVKVDRLYGPQYWEYALIDPSPNPTKDEAGTSWRFLWDTLELTPGVHSIFARSFTQGIGSVKAAREVRDDGTTEPPPGGGGCPDDDDGDGDDDDDDGDSDDDGDDGDDDCEDDDDDEEGEDD